jgi:outer membrane protein OmpA-like peptidoglycan-associated protein
LVAKQALEQAERAHEDSANSFKEKALGYIAHRRSDMAVSNANIAMAKQDLEATDEAYQAASEAELKRVKKRLESQGDKLSATSQELAARKNELEKEKAARTDAEKKAAAAMASLAEIAKIKEEQRGMVITLDGSVLFTTGRSDLLPIAQQKLSQVAQVLQEQDESKPITVEGHTDSRGSDSANMQLSQSRADSVRSYLVSQGVKSERIRAIGRGESQPIADNSTADGRANNRRVEIIVGN